MIASATRRRSVLGWTGALALLVGLLALAPAAAEAHTLTKGKALRAAKALSLGVADELDGSTLEGGGLIDVTAYGYGPCRRRSAHRFLCVIGNEGTITLLDGTVLDYACASRIGVSFRGARSRRLRVALVGEPECEVVPRSQPLAAGAEGGGGSGRGAALTRELARALR